MIRWKEIFAISTIHLSTAVFLAVHSSIDLDSTVLTSEVLLACAISLFSDLEM